VGLPIQYLIKKAKRVRSGGAEKKPGMSKGRSPGGIQEATIFNTRGRVEKLRGRKLSVGGGEAGEDKVGQKGVRRKGEDDSAKCR